MRKLKLFFACLLMAVLSIGQVWGDSYTITLKSSTGTSDSSSGMTSTTVADYVADGASYVSAVAPSGKVYLAKSDCGLKFGNSSGGGSLTFTLATAVKPTSIVVNASQFGASEGKGIFQGEEFDMTGGGGKYVFNNYTVEYDGNTSVTTISVGAEKRGYVKSITVNYGGSTPPPSCTNEITITKADDPANGTFALDNSGTVCIDEGNATVNVTATPAAHYHLATVTSTVGTIGSIAGNTCEITDIDADTEIGVTFEEDTKYQVTWNVNGNEDTKTNVYAGEKPVFPATPAACDVTSTTFYGWATAPWTDKLSNLSEKTVYTSASAMPDVDGAVTYYAVFAKMTGSASVTHTLTITGKTADTNYGSHSETDDKDATWSGEYNYGDATHIGLNKKAANHYLGSPLFAANVTSVKATIKNGASSARSAYLRSDNETAQPSSGDLGSVSVPANSDQELTFTLEETAFKQFYVYVSDPLQFHEFVVTLEGSASYEDYMTTCAAPTCDHLAAPTLDVITKTYNSATIAWNEVADAEEYAVSVINHATSASVFAGNVDALSKALADLEPETQYDYTIMAVGDGTVKCADGNGVLEGSFITDAAPTAHLTLIDLEGEHEATGDYTVGTPFNLPATAATCAKAFYGWTATENYSSENVAPEYKAGDEFTFLNTIGATLYAVYADAEGVEGSVEITPSTTGLPTGYGTANTFTECTLEGVKFQIQQMYKTGSGENLKMQWRAKGNGNGTGTMYNSDVLSNIQSVVLVYHADDTNKNFELTVGSSANPTSGTSITPSGSGTTYTYDCSGGSYNYFVLANGTNAGYLSQITINYFSSFNYSNYSTSCIAAPTAEPASNPLEVAAAAGNGTLNVTYENVNLEGVTVALCDDNQGAAFTGDWLSASIAGDDKHIEYTVQANNSYNDARTAYIQLTAPETNNAATPAVVYIEVTQAKKAAVFGNLADLVAANVNTGTQVTVTFEEIITNDQFISQGSKRAGVMLTTTAGDQDKAIEIFYNKGTTVVPAEWVIGGKLAATSMTFTWTLFTGDQWELIPLGNDWTWDNGDLTYTAPKTVSSVVVSGAPSKTEYVDGEKFAPAGLTVTVNYSDLTSEVNPVGVTFACDPERVAKSESPVSVNVVATFNEVDSDPFEVENLIVGDIQLKTVEQFIAAGNADMRCYLEGIVSNITNTTYGNFDLTDASGKIYVYGCLNQAGEAQKFNELGVAKGDKIKVIAEDYDYYNKHEAKNVVFVSKKSPATMTFDDLALEFGDVETMAPATITLADASDIEYSIKDGSDDCVTIAGDQITAKSVAGTATIVATLDETPEYVGATVEFVVTVTAPITKYAISFDGNGADGGNAPEAIADQAENAEVTLPANTYTLTGNKFDGWKVINNTTSAEVPVAAGKFSMPASAVTIQAQWAPISAWAYVYDNNVKTAYTGSGAVGTITISDKAYRLVKAGSKNNTGTIKVTVPAGATDLHFHAFAWGGQTATVEISGVTNPSVSEFALAGETGAAGSGNDFTLQGVPVDQYYHVSFDAVADETEIVFSKADGSADNRFFLYGVNQVGGNFGSYERTGLAAGNYATICLPNGGTIAGAKLYDLEYYDGSNTLYLLEVNGNAMVAGRPYIFLPSATSIEVTYTNNFNASAGSFNGLVGSYSQQNVNEIAGENYILYQNAYYLVNSPAYVGANRAYIHMDGVPTAPQQTNAPRRRVAMNVYNEQTTTDIDVLNASETPVKMIIDGNLYILRGENLYNVNGQVVK